ncbi:hypothetical protein Lal_00010250 [Lupinus albus]|nr:hypothetical protein Lal_00010250 [Lupinus albus]
MGASLPPKEANLFKLIVKSYETKQYKKGLKAADAILKKIPDHGETLSMKGLTLNCMDRKSEAYELVRQGLKNDLKSHVCWHVFGLLYRSDREYREAIKCYRNALRIDSDNLEILRDLSLLQAQTRDLAGFVETRQQLLTLKANHRMNWIGFAVAHHLNSNASKAVEILEAYEGTLEDDFPPENERCEHGEMLLYKISLLEECGFLEKALEELHKKELEIVDKLEYKEQEVSLLVKLGRFEEGGKLYQSLLSMNPDNYRYYEGLQKCVGLYSENGHFSPDEIDRLDALYKALREQFKWSSAVKRIPLDFLQDDRFKEAADSYIRTFLTKGVPSLFSDLSSLYNHPGKADILEQLILELENSIRTTGQYPGRVEKEPPSTLMWTLFLLAQHYDRRGQYETALSKINEAIKHTPTVIDLYSVKSRILKHAGDLAAAAALADEARCMDLADRYVNSECVKRMLQTDQVDLAEKTAVLFTKEGDQHTNLHDMQCMWYELASADSYYRQGDLGLALKKFLAVEKHYADISEDQFDFHSYCLRKMTLRTYVEMLKFQDRLHSHTYFRKAAAGAIRCYIKLHDSPPKSTTEDDDEMSKLLPSQKRKLRQKQRKAEARAKKEAEEKNEESSAGGASKSGKRLAKPADPDPRGEKLLQVKACEGLYYISCKALSYDLIGADDPGSHGTTTPLFFSSSSTAAIPLCSSPLILTLPLPSTKLTQNNYLVCSQDIELVLSPFFEAQIEHNHNQSISDAMSAFMVVVIIVVVSLLLEVVHMVAGFLCEKAYIFVSIVNDLGMIDHFAIMHHLVFVHRTITTMVQHRVLDCIIILPIQVCHWSALLQLGSFYGFGSSQAPSGSATYVVLAYPGLGAIHHLTSSPNLVQELVKQFSADQIFMGNGINISIKACGHSILYPSTTSIALSLNNLLVVPSITKNLLSVKDPLSEATKYLKLLQKHSPDSLETHLLSFELYMRKQKVLLAFQAVKQLLRLDAEHPDSHRCLIKFFHKVGSVNAPVTDTEKLIWGVLEAERQTISGLFLCSQLHGKSLFEANNSFLEKHKDSLMHRAAFGEMLYILDPNRRSEAVQLIEGSRNNLVQRNGARGQIGEWKLNDCIAVHKLLGTVLVDQDAALRWKVRCAEIFSYSTYFEGSNSSVSPNSVLNQICKSTENRSANHLVVDHNESVISNGKLETFKDLAISQS